MAVLCGDRRLAEAARLQHGARTCACSAVRFAPQSQKICKRKLDLKLFCLTPGRRPRSEGGVTHHQLIKGRNPTPWGALCSETALCKGSSAQTPLQSLFGSCEYTLCCAPKPRPNWDVFIIFSITYKVSSVFILRDQT